MTTKGRNLLSHLADLLRQHGPDDIRQLAATLRDPAFYQALLALLDRAAELVPTKVDVVVNPKERLQTDVESVLRAHPLAAPFLRRICACLRGVKSPQQWQQVHNVARGLGLTLPPRPQPLSMAAVCATISLLPEDSLARVADVLERQKPPRRPSDMREAGNNLCGWSDLIHDRPRRRKDGMHP